MLESDLLTRLLENLDETGEPTLKEQVTQWKGLMDVGVTQESRRRWSGARLSTP